MALLLAVGLRGRSSSARGPRAPRPRHGHGLTAELVRTHQAPGTIWRFILTVLDCVHGVGIVVESPGLWDHPVCVRGVAARRFWRDGGFRRRFPGRKGVSGDFAAASQGAAGHDRAGRDPGPRAGMFKWRGMGGESGKGPALDRRAVPSRRARRMWLLRMSWLCWAVCARRQPAGS